MDDDVLLNLAGTGEDGALPARPRGPKNTWAQRLERRRGRPVRSRSAECLRSNCSLHAQQRCRAAGARPAQCPARQGWAGQGGGAAGTPGATAQGLRPGGRARRAAGAAAVGARSAQQRACRGGGRSQPTPARPPPPPLRPRTAASCRLQRTVARLPPPPPRLPPPPPRLRPAASCSLRPGRSRRTTSPRARAPWRLPAPRCRAPLQRPTPERPLRRQGAPPAHGANVTSAAASRSWPPRAGRWYRRACPARRGPCAAGRPWAAGRAVRRWDGRPQSALKKVRGSWPSAASSG